MPVKHWCERCREIIEPRIAIMMTGKSRHTISNWMNKQLLHTLDLASGRRLICRDSVLTAGTSRVAKKDVHNVKKGKSRRLTPRKKSVENPPDRLRPDGRA
jgi:hypothetical protein